MILRNKELESTLYQLIDRFEHEIVEFKEAKTGFDFDDLGKYFSAISNEANLKKKQFGWLIFGVKNNRQIVGTTYKNSQKSIDELKQGIAEKTSKNLTFIEIYDTLIPVDGANKRVLMFQIPSAVSSIPTAWKGHYYRRKFKWVLYDNN